MPDHLRKTTLRRSENADLWKRFIQPHDWTQAQRRFPGAPWRLYLKPYGTFPSNAWDHFRKTARWVWKTAHAGGVRPGQNRLTLEKILKINSLVLKGTTSRARNILRNILPVSASRALTEMSAVYENHGVQYQNPDGLDIRVEGFWPLKKKSIDFVAAYHELCTRTTVSAATVRKFRRLLRRSFDGRSRHWRVFYLLDRRAIVSQLRRILVWYRKETARISRESRLKPADPVELAGEVLVLAVKMQRYIDITHIAVDGSGRTGQWVQVYVFLQFGQPAPAPAPFQYRRHGPHCGDVYLPLSKAIQKARSGSFE